jgi:hypothetical protein
VLHGFTRLFDGLTDHPGSMARQLLALMSGLEEQWLHDPGIMNLVQEWDRAMETIATSVTSPRPAPGPRLRLLTPTHPSWPQAVTGPRGLTAVSRVHHPSASSARVAWAVAPPVQAGPQFRR